MNEAIRSISELSESNINKTPYDDRDQLLILEDLLSVKTPDDELLLKASDWEADWSSYEGELKKKQREKYLYWKNGTVDDFLEPDSVDNLIFKATETLLPEITRENPEPLVASPTKDSAIDNAISKVLYSWAKINKLKFLGRSVARHWMTSYIGIAKMNWGYKKEDIEINIILPKDIILSEKTIITTQGLWKTPYIGERKTNTAKSLINKFPKKKKEITELVEGKLGTKVPYIEWWADEILFWTCEDFVLDKIKYPHWNEDTTETQVDEYGVEVEVEVAGKNLFKEPQAPYIPLSVFHLGDSPVDVTGLIDQAMHLQDSINQKKLQINKNAKSANNGYMVDSSKVTTEVAEEAIRILEEGGAIHIDMSDGDPIKKIEASSLPNFIYDSIIDDRNELEGIFGVQGSNPRGIAQEKTVRGKIIATTQDTKRSNSITEALELFYENIYKYILQMMMVYYDEEKEIVDTSGVENETLRISSDMIPENISVTVKEGSLVPKDPLTERNEAMDLFSAGALDPITLYEKLDFKNPQEAAKRLITWQLAPQQLLGQGQVPQGVPQQPQGQPQAGQQPAPEEQSTDIMQQVPIN